jgi:GTP cyclohydrolase FolE2
MSLPDIDFELIDSYERGREAGIIAVLKRFDEELYIATKEDPHYAAYVEDAIKLIKTLLKD